MDVGSATSKKYLTKIFRIVDQYLDISLNISTAPSVSATAVTATAVSATAVSATAVSTSAVSASAVKAPAVKAQAVKALIINTSAVDGSTSKSILLNSICIIKFKNVFKNE